MMRKLLYFFMLFAFMQVSLAQGEYDNEIPQNNEEEFVGFNKKGKEKKDLSRIRIGGGAGFGLGANQLGFSISPTIGYQIVENRVEIGTGLLYDYYRFKDSNPGLKYVENTVGSNNYIRLYIWEGLFAQLRGVYQKTYLNLNSVSLAPLRQGNVFGGAGYQYQVGEKVFANFGLEINLIPYDSPLVNNRDTRIISPFFQFQFSL